MTQFVLESYIYHFFLTILIVNIHKLCFPMEVVGGLIGVCYVGVSLVFHFFAWEEFGDDDFVHPNVQLICPGAWPNLEADSFSNTPEATPVPNVTTTPSVEKRQPVGKVCIYTFYNVVYGRYGRMVPSICSSRRPTVPPGLVMVETIVDEDAIPDGVVVVKVSPVVSDTATKGAVSDSSPMADDSSLVSEVKAKADDSSLVSEVEAQDAVSDDTPLVDETLVVSEAKEISIVKPGFAEAEEVSGSAEKDLQVETAPAVEACVLEAYPSTESTWTSNQDDDTWAVPMDLDPWWFCGGEPMEVDPWWIDGSVLCENTPDIMDIDGPVEEDLGVPDFDVVMASPESIQDTQTLGALYLQEHSDIVACEDILMAEVPPSEVMKVIVQDHMKCESHSNSGEQRELHVAAATMPKSPSFEGARPVVTAAPEEKKKIQGVVLNKDSEKSSPPAPSRSKEVSTVLNNDVARATSPVLPSGEVDVVLNKGTEKSVLQASSSKKADTVSNNGGFKMPLPVSSSKRNATVMDKGGFKMPLPVSSSSKDGRAVLNKDAYISALPTRAPWIKTGTVLKQGAFKPPLPVPGPVKEHLVDPKIKVLPPAPEENQGSFEGRSHVASTSSKGKGKHRVGCDCVRCAADKAKDLAEVGDFFSALEKEEKEEEADKKVIQSLKRMGKRSRNPRSDH